MSLKGTAMTYKVLRGKIKDIHQIEDVEALYAEAEDLIEKANTATETAEESAAVANGAADNAAIAAEEARNATSEMLALIQSYMGRIAYIDLLSANWQGEASPYSQVVAIDGVTENSKVDINPSIEQLAIFHAKDILFVAENEDGTVTVYCLGQKPTADYQMQVTISEVIANG